MTNDPSVIPDYTINPGYQGVNFQSSFPITITYQFNCVVYLKYICIIGEFTNVNKFSYLILDINGQNIGQGVINRLTLDQCTPRPLPTAELANKVIITIEGTTDGQPPRNMMIDIQGCSLLPVSLNMISLLKNRIELQIRLKETLLTFKASPASVQPAPLPVPVCISLKIQPF